MLKHFNFLSFSNSVQVHVETGNFGATGSSYEITILSPGTQYTIRVEGESTQLTEQMYATSKETRFTQCSHSINYMINKYNK